MSARDTRWVQNTAQHALTYPNIVVAGARRQAALAIGFEVGRVDRVRVVIIVVPVYDQRSRLHFEDEATAEPLPWEDVAFCCFPFAVRSCGLGRDRGRLVASQAMTGLRENGLDPSCRIN